MENRVFGCHCYTWLQGFRDVGKVQAELAGGTSLLFLRREL